MYIKLKRLLHDRAFMKELISYGITGVLTTAISYAVYYAVTRGTAGISDIAYDNALLILIANTLSWVCSVAFAFYANKKYVFHSTDTSRATVRRELAGFAAARLLSLLIDNLVLELCVYLGMHDLIAKLLSNVIVIIINYFLSKFLIFKKKDV